MNINSRFLPQSYLIAVRKGIPPPKTCSNIPMDRKRLKQRRLRGDLIETYKILTRKEDLDPEIFFKYSTTGNLHSSNSIKLFKPRTKLKVRQNFFSQKVIDYWNALPEHAVKAPSTNSFKARLDKNWKAKKWDDIKANCR